MRILAADTSLPLLTVALTEDDRLIGSMTLEGKGSRNEKLLPAVDWLLAETGTPRERIDLFAVTRGPGSFTGVRIGLATLQGLALVLGRPLCAMSTHEAVAHDFAEAAIVITDDAGRGEFYVSRFENGIEQVAPRLAAGAAVDDLGRGAEVIPLSEYVQRASVAVACARRAHQIARSGRLPSYAEITPIYVRLAEAEVKLQQRRNA